MEAIVTMSIEEHAAAVERMNGMEFHLEQLRNREYCDATLRAVTPSALRESQPVYVHKIILESASPFFESLFASGTPNQDNFAITGINRSTLEFLLNCIYNCDVGVIDAENMFHVFIGAKLLQLPAIQTVCEKFMESTRNIDNCLQLWSFGKKEGCAGLSDLTFIMDNLEAVSHTSYFMSLTKPEIEELLSSIATPTARLSKHLLLTLHKWVKAETEHQDPEKRISEFLSLVRKLPREQLDHKDFANIFLADGLLKNNRECQKFRDEYLCEFFSQYLKHQASNESSDANSPKESPKIQPKGDEIVTNCSVPAVKSARRKATPESNIGLEEEGSTTKRVKVRPKKFDDGINEEEVIQKKVNRSVGRPPKVKTEEVNGSDEKEPFRKGSVSSRPRKLMQPLGPIPLENSQEGHCFAYYIANSGGTRFINAYDFQTGDISRVGQFQKFRENGVFMVADNFVYYLGGRTVGEKADSNKIDIFDLNSKTWQCDDCLELDEGRCYFNCAVLNDQIYIVAGFRAESCIDSVERIPIGKSTVLAGDIEEVTNVRWPKNRSPLAVINNKVYSVGGAVAEGGANAWASAFVECYDPLTNHWSEVRRMPTPRVGHAVVVLDSKLYALGGGRSETAFPVYRFTTVEVYDPMTDTWESRTSMKKKRQYGSAFAFRGCIYAVGGDSPKHPTIEKYDPVSDTWELLNSSTLPVDADYSSMIFQANDIVNE